MLLSLCRVSASISEEGQVNAPLRRNGFLLFPYSRKLASVFLTFAGRCSSIHVSSICRRITCWDLFRFPSSDFFKFETSNDSVRKFLLAVLIKFVLFVNFLNFYFMKNLHFYFTIVYIMKKILQFIF